MRKKISYTEEFVKDAEDNPRFLVVIVLLALVITGSVLLEVYLRYGGA